MNRVAASLGEALVRGDAEMRAGRFFEAHEEWENVWMTSEGEERLFLQALIQIAAACVHFSRGRAAPGARLLDLAAAKLERTTTPFAGVDVARLARQVVAVRAAAVSGEELPDLSSAFTFRAG